MEDKNPRYRHTLKDTRHILEKENKKGILEKIILLEPKIIVVAYEHSYKDIIASLSAERDLMKP